MFSLPKCFSLTNFADETLKLTSYSTLLITKCDKLLNMGVLFKQQILPNKNNFKPLLNSYSK